MNKLRKYKCKKCGGKFKTKRGLMAHQSKYRKLFKKEM